MATSPAPAMTRGSIFRRAIFGIIFVSGLQSSIEPVRHAGRINSWPSHGPDLITRTDSMRAGAGGTPITPLPYCEINRHASLEHLSSFRLHASYLPVYSDSEGSGESLGAAPDSIMPYEVGSGHTDSEVSDETYEIAPEIPARPVGLALLLEPPDLLQLQFQNRRSVSSLGVDNTPSSVASLPSHTQSFSSSSGSGQANDRAAEVAPVQPAPASPSQLSSSSEESGFHMRTHTRTWSLRHPAQEDIASAASSVSSGLSDVSDASDESVGHWVAHAVANHELEPVQHLDHLVYSSVLSISDQPSPSAAPSTRAGFVGVRLKRDTWPLKPSPGMKRRLSGWGQEYPAKRARAEDHHGIDAAMVAS